MAQNAPGPSPTAELSDEELVRRYRQGQDEMFAALVGRYRQELFRFLTRFVSDAAIAEDLFQETFLQVHQSLDTFDVDRTFKPWLFTIASNKARDYLRRSHQRQMVSLSASHSSGDSEQTRSLVDLLRDDLPMPTEQVQQQEIQALVRQTVDAMPDHLREILILSYFQQMPYKRIAEMLQIPLGTVKSRLHAAVATFAQVWKHRYEERQEQGKASADQAGQGGDQNATER